MAKAKTPKSPSKVRVQPVRLTNAVKIREIKRMFPQLLKAQGLLDTVVLTVRAPFVANVADCEFKLPNVVSAREDFVEFPRVSPDDSVFLQPSLTVNLKIVHANKAHLLTFYVHSEHGQSYALNSHQPADDQIHQTVHASSGQQALLFAFVPAKGGQRRFSFFPERTGGATKPFDFSRVEIDVLS